MYCLYRTKNEKKENVISYPDFDRIKSTIDDIMELISNNSLTDVPVDISGYSELLENKTGIIYVTYVDYSTGEKINYEIEVIDE